MQVEFVNRRQPLDRLSTLIRTKVPTKRLVLLDSPAGMGKTDLLIQVCRELLQHADQHQETWKIVRLDFRDHYLKLCNNREDILAEIARQICRDVRWDHIRTLVEKADPDDQMLIQQAASIPMIDESRRTLLRTVRNILSQDLEKIHELIVEAFDNVDVSQLRQMKDFENPTSQVSAFVDFINQKKSNLRESIIPGNILFVLDGLDAIGDEQLRNWVISELILELHHRLKKVVQRFFFIVSGRFIEQDLVREDIGQYEGIELDPFTPDVVEDLIRQFGNDEFNDQQLLVSRLARKLSQVCGGHPRVIKETAIQLYERSDNFVALVANPSEVEDWYNDRVIKESLGKRRDKAINDIVEGVTLQQRRLLELLSVFRKFNSATLKVLSFKIQSSGDRSVIPPYRECLQGRVDELLDDLLRTHLIWDGGDEMFCSDRIILGLMAAQMQEQKPVLFRFLNEWAVDIFADWVVGRFPDNPNALQPIPGDYQKICVGEWLFHRLNLVGQCRSMTHADRISQRISREFHSILNHVLPCPGETTIVRQLQRIRHRIERDQQINHQIREVALEDPARYQAIRNQIMAAFSIDAQGASFTARTMTAPQMPQQVDSARLRENLVLHFNVSELKNLCSDLKIDYDDLPGSTKGDKARELVDYCKRHGLVSELVKACRKARPKVAW